jgi:hypothetical protein
MVMSTPICRSIGSTIWYPSCLAKSDRSRASSSTLRTKFNNCNASSSTLETSSTFNSSLQSVDPHPKGYRRLGTLADQKMAVHESDQIVDIIMVVPHCEKQPRYMRRECCQVFKGEKRRWEGMSISSELPSRWP